jgi:WD40 repeat protein
MDILEYIENNYEGWEIAEDGKYLYNLGSEDQDTIIFDVKNKSIFEIPSDMNNCLLFYSHSNDFVICASDNIINIFMINGRKSNLIKKIEAHDYSITSLIKTDKYIISASNDETIKLWSLDNFELVYTFNHNDDVLCLNYYNNYLISGDFEGTVKIWDLETFELINEISTTDYIVSVAISDKWIAFSASNSKLYIIDFELNNISTFSHQKWYIYFLQF